MIDRVAVWYERYSVELLGYIRRLTGGHIDAEDILSRVFYEALRNQDGLNDTPRAWLYLVARSRVIDWRRHEARHGTLPLTEYAARRMEDAIIDRLWAEDACATLNPRERTVLQMRYVEGWSIEQTAARMGTTQMAVKALTHRACVAIQNAAPGGSR